MSVGKIDQNKRSKLAFYLAEETKEFHQTGLKQEGKKLNPLPEDFPLDRVSDSRKLSEVNRRLKRRLYDLFTLFEISRHLNSVLEIKTLLDGILLTCVGQMGVGGAMILLQNGKKRLTVQRSKGITSSRVGEVIIESKSELIQLFLRKNRAMLVEEVAKEANLSEELEKIRLLEGELCVPLIMKREVKGLLLLTKKISGNMFTTNDLEFLSTLANQLVVAIENAQLYEKVRRANIKLRKTQQRLIRTEKLAAVGKLAASIAHEVNNPLGIIKNYLLLISQSLETDDPNFEHLTIVKEEVDRIARIVRQMLDFYRPESEQLTSIDVNEVVEETLTMMDKQLSQDNVIVCKDLILHPPRIMASTGQLKQVFLNLIMNARDFMPTGGTLTIKSRRENDSLKIEFVDTGCGIPEENLDHLFEPFFSTKEGKGSGLGLSVCYGIIQRHRGDIEVKSKVGKGTTFIVSLPIGGAKDAS